MLVKIQSPNMQLDMNTFSGANSTSDDDISKDTMEALESLMYTLMLTNFQSDFKKSIPSMRIVEGSSSVFPAYDDIFREEFLKASCDAYRKVC